MLYSSCFDGFASAVHPKNNFKATFIFWFECSLFLKPFDFELSVRALHEGVLNTISRIDICKSHSTEKRTTVPCKLGGNHRAKDRLN